jgi:multidrug transporter EmrE-like cation transporter
MRYVFLFGTIAVMAAGQILFKLTAAADPDSTWSFLFSPTFILAVCMYGLAAFAWVFVLRAWPLTVAYPAQALAIAIVLGIGFFGFGEVLSTVQLVGIAAILAGLVLLVAG